MIVKFLYTRKPNGSFPAVSYNTGKMDRNNGELMKVANFGPLQNFGQPRPQDYKNYLQMVSARNKSVIKPQFHVAISAEGKTYDKHQLTEIASQWLEKMGYSKQPYLIIFHKDTQNNHVHIVSTRVTREGKKIRDSFEQIRGLEQMQLILGTDPKQSASHDLAKALTYHFQTQAQFRMILESGGYHLKETGDQLQAIKFGKVQGHIPLINIAVKLGSYKKDEKRAVQLKALFHKYAASYSTILEKDRGVYGSDFSRFIKVKFGIDLLFHASGDKPLYGYSIIDHSTKQVYKGGEVMALQELLNRQSQGAAQKDEVKAPQPLSVEQAKYYSALLKAALYNYPDLLQGLHHSGLFITRNGEGFTLHDPGAGFSADTGDLLSERDHHKMTAYFNDSPEQTETHQQHFAPIPAISIADDIDDQQVLGMKRRRKKKARTNTR